MAISNISANDDNLLQSLQRSILEKTTQGICFNALFSDKPLQSSIDENDSLIGKRSGSTNYGALDMPLIEIDQLAAEQRGELAKILGSERSRFEKALRLQQWNEDQGGRLRRLLDHNTLRKSKLLKQSDAYPPGMKKVKPIRGLQYLLKKGALDFSYPTNQLLYGDRENIVLAGNNVRDGRVFPSEDPIQYFQQSIDDNNDNNNDGSSIGPPPFFHKVLINRYLPLHRVKILSMMMNLSLVLVWQIKMSIKDNFL